MECTVNDVPVHYAEYGSGRPLLALHGAGVDHQEIAGGLEPLFRDRTGYRRIYPDLPAMGRTPAPDSIASNDDVVDLLLGLVDRLVGDEPFVVVGHSYGAYLARAIANRRRDQTIGLGLFCAAGEHSRDVPSHVVVYSTGEVADVLEGDIKAEYEGYFVVQTPETLRLFQDYVAPGVPLVDSSGLERIFARWELRERPESGPAYPHPALILTGRQDSTVGYASQWDLIEHYPRATFAVLDRAGHALLHEQIPLVHSLIGEWLDRVEERVGK